MMFEDAETEEMHKKINALKEVLENDARRIENYLGDDFLDAYRALVQKEMGMLDESLDRIKRIKITN